MEVSVLGQDRVCAMLQANGHDLCIGHGVSSSPSIAYDIPQDLPISWAGSQKLHAPALKEPLQDRDCRC